MLIRILKSSLDYSYSIVIEDVIGNGPMHSVDAVSNGYLRNMECEIDGDLVRIKSDISYASSITERGFDYRLFRDKQMNQLPSRIAVKEYCTSWSKGITSRDQRFLADIN